MLLLMLLPRLLLRLPASPSPLALFGRIKWACYSARRFKHERSAPRLACGRTKFAKAVHPTGHAAWLPAPDSEEKANVAQAWRDEWPEAEWESRCGDGLKRCTPKLRTWHDPASNRKFGVTLCQCEADHNHKTTRPHRELLSEWCQLCKKLETVAHELDAAGKNWNTTGRSRASPRYGRHNFGGS